MKMNERLDRRLVLVITALFALVLVYGCGSSSRDSAGTGETAPPARVWSESGTNTCHAVTVDVTGDVLAVEWANTTNTTVQGVQCEDCHGPAGNHFGVGPIPFPTPQAAQC